MGISRFQWTGLGAAALMVGLLAWAAVLPVSAQDAGQDELPPPPPGECYEWQHKDDQGDCQDPPDLHVHHGHYDPPEGVQCWAMELCLCEEGQSPSSNSCAPCSDAGEEDYCVGG